LFGAVVVILCYVHFSVNIVNIVRFLILVYLKYTRINVIVYICVITSAEAKRRKRSCFGSVDFCQLDYARNY